ncbi:MAG: hypothetical protein KUG79_02600, partial [Pseudomonadales bacterium]|nr:hypothetical protein [Pseudomonadales bacterium]
MAMPYYPGKTIFLRLCFLLTAAAILFLSVCIQVNADSKQVVLLEESFTSRYITAPIEYQLNSYYDVYTPAGLNKKKTNWKKLTGPATFLFEDRIGWIKFPVSNHSSNTQWVFEVDWSKGAFVSLDMFYRAAPGDEYIKIERDARQRFYTWSLQLKPFETGSIIFRGHAPQLLSLPVRLYRAEHYALETLNLTAAVSFLISIIIALSVFNFFIGLRTRDETHLWYSLAQFGFGCFFMFYYGLDHKLYASYPRQLLLIGTCVAVYFGIVGMYFFILNYMDFRKKHPRLYPFMLGMIMCIFLAISLYGHVHTSIPATLYFIFMGGTLIFVLGVALKAAIRGDQLALYFLLIWLLVAVFLAFFDAQAMGLIERTVFTNHSILIAFALEALLFSFALGERINALAQKNFEASASARVKSEFLAQMSHEIRTPMNAIIGMSQLMGLTQLEKKQQFYNNLVQSSAESLLCIINDILDFSKIEAGKLNLEKIPFSLNELIQGVLGIFYSHVKRTDIPL